MRARPVCTRPVYTRGQKTREGAASAVRHRHDHRHRGQTSETQELFDADKRPGEKCGLESFSAPNVDTWVAFRTRPGECAPLPRAARLALGGTRGTTAIYTGIVQDVCPVTRIQRGEGTTALTVDLGALGEGLQPGASVALNGCCLTAVGAVNEAVSFDLIRETLENTNLGGLRMGSRVNIERSFRVGDEVGGHILSGHVAAAVVVTDIVAKPGLRRISVEVPGQWLGYLMDKGFVALNGASLTIADIDRNRSTITVSLIPETLARTTFGQVQVGDRLNLEVDARTQAVVDTVRQMLPDLVARMSRG